MQLDFQQRQIMKIYTKSGDKGTTSLVGGKRVPKNHPRIEAYGTVDELIAFIGFLRDQQLDKHTSDNLFHIQDKLMACAAILASDEENNTKKMPKILKKDVLELEKEIDTIESNLRPLHSFIIPGGHPAVSLCHIIRAVCRRAERSAITLSRNYYVPEIILTYLNRLSDYFFVLSRKLTIDFQAIEYHWKQGLDML